MRHAKGQIQQLLRRSILIGVIANVGMTGCTKSSPSSDGGDPQQQQKNETIEAKQEKPGIQIPSGNLPRPSGDDGGEIVWLGGIITTRVIAGQVFIPVEGTFSEGSFAAITEASSAQGMSDAQRNAVMKQEAQSVIAAIGRSMKVISAQIVAEVGYFTALIPLEGYVRLSEVTGLSRRILINPVLSIARDPSTLGLKSASSVSLGLHADPLDGRADTDSYSGLARIGVDEFLTKVRNEVGVDADGLHVNVGVTDTGITFNHPAFLDAAGQNRIKYMKDFTGEGLIYFTNAARFEAREPIAAEVPNGVNAANVIVLTAQYLLPPQGTRAPTADRFSDLTAQVFVVDAALKTELLTANSGARLGVFSESSLNAADGSESVDLNHNGKTDDLLFAILLPNSDVARSRLFLDKTGRGDFRGAVALSDWNTTKTTMDAYSERFGFEIKEVSLLDSQGNDVDAVGAAIVGFDPGNHGSHVSGIIAGRKTIANDQENTRARGVAPNTNLMLNRVCANNGGCNATNAIIDLSLGGAEVINMSLGGLGPLNDGYGVQETIINRLTLLRNTLFVISAGNSGPGKQTVGSPSVARLALSVAATASRRLIERQYQWPGSGKTVRSQPGNGVDDEDFVLFFSSRGPTAAGGLKPNVAAPGTELSTIQLNSAPGARPGLDVYWGTSMAAPTAAGAIALLVDAAKRYNTRFPNQALPLDARVLHKVISNSARPFDIQSYNVGTRTRSLGQYTWIDQGHGMINLSAAWDALKAERDAANSSGVTLNGSRVNLDYEVRVLRQNPNGLDYTGAIQAPTDAQGGLEPRFGRGIYLSANSQESLVEVQVARRLPFNLLRLPNVGELARQLNTTAEQFAIETTVYGSDVEWLKAGSLEQLDCASSPTAGLTIIGPGPVDAFEAPPGAPRSIGLRASNLQVCLNRTLMAALPPGDHGAIIKGYRVNGGIREPNATLEIPVYLAVPHATLAGHAGYRIQQTVKAFAVDRNYVNIPAGTSTVTVTIEVPTARVSGNTVAGCAGVELMILEGENTASPAELKPRSRARAQNCDRAGATPNKRRISYSRMNPRAGIWDIHVFGQYQYKESLYTLTVDFARVSASVAEISGRTAALNGSLEFEVLDASMTVAPSAQNSVYELNSLIQEVTADIHQDEELRVLDLDGVAGRTYDATVSKVNFATGGLTGSDIDLAVLECDDAAGQQCGLAGQSAGSTDVESVDVTPVAGKYYFAIVVGYDVLGGTGNFRLTETRRLAAPEAGALAVSPNGQDKFKVDYTFNVNASQVLRSGLFTGGKFAAGGDLIIKGADSASLLRLPVRVSVN